MTRMLTEAAVSPLLFPHDEAERDRPVQTVIEGDCLAHLRTMPPEIAKVVVTSPPYNFGATYSLYDDKRPLHEYLANQREVAAEIARVLRLDGHVFLVVGNKADFPWRSVEVAQAWATALALRQHIAWVKSIALDASSLPNPAMRAEMHERTFGHFVSLTTKRVLNPCHESVWHFTRSDAGTAAVIDREAIGVRYTYDDQPERFGHGRKVHCRGNVWHVPTPTVQHNGERFHHPASFPPALAELCIKLSGATGDDLVLDPLSASAQPCLRLSAVACAAWASKSTPNIAKPPGSASGGCCEQECQSIWQRHGHRGHGRCAYSEAVGIGADCARPVLAMHGCSRHLAPGSRRNERRLPTMRGPLTARR
jgi:site-specific DNA-methyltransferase (adenine-specific)